jgi:RNA polymerase sigma factor (sigma-70 family)
MAASAQPFSSLGYRVIFAIDIVEFANPHRTDQDRILARENMSRMFRNALDGSGVSLDLAHREDRGDGMLLVLPPEASPELLIVAVPQVLASRLREHNRTCGPESLIKLRLSVHVGEVSQDRHGMIGASLHQAFRLLESADFKHAQAESSADLALIVSDSLYGEALRSRPIDFDPDDYQPITARHRDASAKAWIRLFSSPFGPSAPVPREDLTEDAGYETESDGGLRGHDFDGFYTENFRLVRNVLNARAQDWTLAEEVADEAMTIAYRKWEELLDHPNPVGFVIVTARRILSRIQRQRAAKAPALPLVSLEATPGLEPRANAADPADTAVERAILRQAFGSMPPDQRECLILHELLNHSTRQIAELLGVPEGTVKTRLRLARRTFRALTDDLGKEGPS